MRELWRFKWREHRHSRVVGAYHTRRGGLPYFIRHGTFDIGIFSEVFVLGDYEPPLVVVERLALLDRPPRVLDLGANIGMFAVWCRERWPGAHVVSVEPDPDNLELLRRAAGRGGGIEVVPACAGCSDGTVRFVAGKFTESHVPDPGSSEETIEVSRVDVFGLAQSTDLVKMDIEGSEWEILADSRLRALPAAAWVMEWHADRCPHPDPSTAARAALQAAGFDVVCERAHPAFRDAESRRAEDRTRYATIWAMRPASS